MDIAAHCGDIRSNHGFNAKGDRIGQPRSHSYILVPGHALIANMT
jgi:hypothetical protein